MTCGYLVFISVQMSFPDKVSQENLSLVSPVSHLESSFPINGHFLHPGGHGPKNEVFRLNKRFQPRDLITVPQGYVAPVVRLYPVYPPGSPKASAWKNLFISSRLLRGPPSVA
jgi:hypothetical protein